MLLVDDLAAGGTKNLRHTPRGLVTLEYGRYSDYLSNMYYYLELLSGLVVSMSDSGTRGPGSIPGWALIVHCFLFLAL